MLKINEKISVVRGVIVVVVQAALTQLDLQCGVIDAEALQQRGIGIVDELVVAVTGVAHDMGGQCDFLGAERPDMQMVHSSTSR